MTEPTKTWKVQTWVREVEDEFGTTTQYLEQRDGHFYGWEVYEDGRKSERLLMKENLVPIGYREVTP